MSDSTQLVWYSQQDDGLAFGEQVIPGGTEPAVEHAKVLMREKEILLGQILSHDGRVLAHFTGGAKDDIIRFAN
jgi:hypothetical protein